MQFSFINGVIIPVISFNLDVRYLAFSCLILLNLSSFFNCTIPIAADISFVSTAQGPIKTLLWILTLFPRVVYPSITTLVPIRTLFPIIVSSLIRTLCPVLKLSPKDAPIFFQFYSFHIIAQTCES